MYGVTDIEKKVTLLWALFLDLGKIILGIHLKDGCFPMKAKSQAQDEKAVF